MTDPKCIITTTYKCYRCQKEEGVDIYPTLLGPGDAGGPLSRRVSELLEPPEGWGLYTDGSLINTLLCGKCCEAWRVVLGQFWEVV